MLIKVKSSCSETWVSAQLFKMQIRMKFLCRSSWLKYKEFGKLQHKDISPLNKKISRSIQNSEALVIKVTAYEERSGEDSQNPKWSSKTNPDSQEHWAWPSKQTQEIKFIRRRPEFVSSLCISCSLIHSGHRCYHLVSSLLFPPPD